ncbi:MAG: DUF502 domain-containing protein [Thiomicrorhabdus sp.]|jgi:uncharacterized membrane protein|nr:DUF502 domain-containing protein [Thiomicrorhabdus sp.]
MFGFISRYMLTGLITILPIVLTFYLLYWLAVSAESVLGGLIQIVLPSALYWPGMGVVAGLGVLFLIGLVMHTYVVQLLFSKLEQLFSHMPIVKPIYGAFRDFLDYFKPKKEQDFEQVVSVQVNDNMKVIGFITEHEMHKLPDGFNDDDSILVYLPLSYMIGGYAVLVPKSTVTPVDLSMEEAMRFSLTAGMTGSGGRNHKK